jgi:hypothetical protein
MGDSESVRVYVNDHYIVPARRSGAGTVTVRASEVHRAMNWDLRKVSQVCSALSTRKFLRAASVELIARKGPPSGQSTTVEFVFKLLEIGPPQPSALQDQNRENRKPKLGSLMAAYGILKDAYREFGGGEAYLKAERDAWGPDPWEKLEHSRKRETGSGE